ncbi:MAG: hypothetical protein LKF69_05030 [Bacilli bacterium]|jgi:uncharacterized membrane protein|nr:hypothetical protein [Bacilli bacterium]MCH4236141.1 hypothetical protein [Bacilli bacterium]
MSTENDASKKSGWLRIGLTIGEIVLIAFLLTVSIIAMTTVGSASGSTNPFMGFIKWLQLNPLFFFLLIVFPLILIFLFNIYLLIKNLNDKNEKTKQKMSKEELLEEAKRQAREEVLAEIAKQQAQNQEKK